MVNKFEAFGDLIYKNNEKMAPDAIIKLLEQIVIINDIWVKENHNSIWLLPHGLDMELDKLNSLFKGTHT